MCSREKVANVFGTTPLHAAVAWSRAEACKLLMDIGADPNATDEEGKTPMDIAREYGNERFFGGILPGLEAPPQPRRRRFR